MCHGKIRLSCIGETKYIISTLTFIIIYSTTEFSCAITQLLSIFSSWKPEFSVSAIQVFHVGSGNEAGLG
jgi:hypothetical protein